MAPVNTVRTACLPPPKKEEPHVFVKSLNSKGAIPQLAHQGDAGYDLRSVEDICLAPEETVLVHTGLAMEIPPGYFGKIKAKSGLAPKGLRIPAGVIDSNYQGEICIVAEN